MKREEEQLIIHRNIPEHWLGTYQPSEVLQIWDEQGFALDLQHWKLNIDFLLPSFVILKQFQTLNKAPN